ncbi:diguanylate cyclase [Duganella sp. FT92W]|uniref:Diguanylate cyclase n=1 Tax=Pseudoduganella rivuli TaxID=2666085 RepID=A0A7X2IJL0_9BURK|nr:diguanylate cyclase [Pseudoduganella rivuli]MRV71049.1 diguanylate cyclase [Pseudoduganella rivuli]
MHIFDTVSAQVSAMGLPLYAVSATRVNLPDTPLLLFLHWHGFRRATPLQLEGVDLPARPVPSSAFQFDGPWATGTAAEEDVLDAAWRLGAWSVERLQQRACNTPGARASEAYACRLAFGDNAADYPDEPVLASELPAREQLMELAARKGYSRWLFQPVKGGLWAGIGPGDDSLASDGGRQSDCPVRPAPAGGDARLVYQLDHIEHLILP